jgi:ABC-type polysaccharide/polyol phosphate transport system ATPase subunit
MSFTSTSNNILEVDSLDIKYKTSIHGINSLRDIFVNALTNPAKLLFNKRSTLDILNNVNFQVKNGDRLAILGVNGSGKTSLCRTISGMHGENKAIKLNGDVRAIFDTSVVVQPELSGRENAWILTNLLFSKYSKEERIAILKDAVDFSELDYFIHTPFKLYSKGMKTRLFLSVVSARPSDLLILDEVFSGADTFFNDKISQRVEDMISQSGAVIFISHVEDIVKKVCNRGIVLYNKKIAYDGDIKNAMAFYNKINHGGMLT